MQRLRHRSIRRYTHYLMPMRIPELSDSTLAAIDAALGKSSWRSGTRVASIDRFRADLQAIRFHLKRSSHSPTALIAILGGTGTGKSTLLNRLLGADVAAASFRRTFTAGAIAVTCDASRIPKQWPGVEHCSADTSQLPSRGQADRLTPVVTMPTSNDLTGQSHAHRHAGSRRRSARASRAAGRAGFPLGRCGRFCRHAGKISDDRAAAP